MYLAPASHWSNPLQTKRSSGVGVYGGQAGKTGAAWLFPGDTVDVAATGELLGLDADTYRRTTPIAGVLNPQTKVVDHADGEYYYFASTPNWQTTANAVFRYLTNGGGGWGDPLDRATERVLRDVRDEYVSVEGAQADYGVVVLGDPFHDPEGLHIDEVATKRLRSEMKAARA